MGGRPASSIGTGPANAGALTFVIPNWDAPANVRAAATTRIGGQSAAPFTGLNLGSHVGDDARSVAANREQLKSALGLPAEPAWLNQVHGTDVIELAASAEPPSNTPGTIPTADGAWTQAPSQVCAILTADCLPVLLCNRGGTVVAGVHAGWRGLAAGVLEACVTALPSDPQDLLAWVGPAISAAHYQVDRTVYDAFASDVQACPEALLPDGDGHWRADLPRLAAHRLHQAGVRTVTVSGECTAGDLGRYYSYRAEGQTGRFATLIWLES